MTEVDHVTKVRMALAELGFRDAIIQYNRCDKCGGMHTHFGIGTVTAEAAWKALDLVGESNSCLPCFQSYSNSRIHECLDGRCASV